MSDSSNQLTDAQLKSACEELIVKFPKVQRLPVDPPLAGQNTALFSFKLLPQPVNGVYGFLKFRGAFATDADWEAHAKNIIRTIDSKHHIYPYQQGRWMPITVNDDFVQEALEVSKNDEIVNIFNQKEKQEDIEAKQRVREIKDRERKLMEQIRDQTPDTDSLDYYAQQVMKIQQLESWLETMRKRKRDMLKALEAGKAEMKRVEKEHPEYLDQVNDKIITIKKEIGLEPDAPLDRPSFGKATTF